MRRVYDAAREPGLERAAPVIGLLRSAAREVRRADPGGTALAAGLQVVGALAALGVVGSGKLALDAILTPETAAAGLPLAMALLALTTALVGSVGVLQTQQQRLLGERVGQRVWQRILDVAGRVDLLTYETAGFATRLERVQQNVVNRPLMVTSALLGLSGGLIGAVSMSVLLLAIQPLLLPILLAAGLPAVLVSRRASRLEFEFTEEVTPLVRRRFYLRQLLSQRAYAAELRAFASGPRLTAAQNELNRSFAARLRVHVRRRQLLALLSTAGVGLALALALLAIVALVRTGRLSLAEAGAAAIAVRLLSGQLTAVFGAVGSLQECAPFLADLQAFVAAAPAGSTPGVPHPLTGALVLDGVRFCSPNGRSPLSTASTCTSARVRSSRWSGRTVPARRRSPRSSPGSTSRPRVNCVGTTRRWPPPTSGRR